MIKVTKIMSFAKKLEKLNKRTNMTNGNERKSIDFGRHGLFGNRTYT